ncbi:MAG TPA: hypothetical protein VNM90_11275 [Haliangium sp.]|nr:hypothetical protein [Haliangium sp.]
MNRNEFEALRNLHDKVIRGDIQFSRPNQTRPLSVAEVAIENASGVDLRLSIRFNPEVGSKTFNVFIRGVGPICRLDVDGPAHGAAGRQHKHSLQTERCPERNLPDGVQPWPELAGRSVRECFTEFCRISNVSHIGNIFPPDERT